MADILIATLPPSFATSDDIENARRMIDDAFLKSLEKRLRPVGLKSPNTKFRHDILEAVARYLSCPTPEELNRTNLRELIEYVCKVHHHLSALQKMLPSTGKHDQLQSNLLLAVFGVIFACERHLEGPDYLAFRNLLDAFAEAVTSIALALGKERVPSAKKRTAVEWLVRVLADIFRERTGHDPQQHICANRNKDEFKGSFFDLARDILTRVGDKRQNAQHGRMIERTLRKLGGGPKRSRPN